MLLAALILALNVLTACCRRRLFQLDGFFFFGMDFNLQLAYLMSIFNLNSARVQYQGKIHVTLKLCLFHIQVKANIV